MKKLNLIVSGLAGSSSYKKTTKKYCLYLLTIIMLLFLMLGQLTACASSSKNYNAVAPQEKDEGYYEDFIEETHGASVDNAGGKIKSDMEIKGERKIVRNADITIKVVDVTVAYQAILSQAEEKGAYEFSRDQYEQNERTVIRAQVKIAPEALDEMIEFIREQGEMVSLSIGSLDITDDYFDTALRLDNMEKTLDKYYEYLEDSVNIEETLMVQAQIDQLTYDIEALKGRLKLWDSQLAESTIDLYIYQIDDPIQVRKEVSWSALSFDDMRYIITAGLKSVINVLTGSVQWLLVLLIAGAPVWILILIIVVIILRVRKNKLRKKLAKLAEEENSQENK